MPNPDALNYFAAPGTGPGLSAILMKGEVDPIDGTSGASLLIGAPPFRFPKIIKPREPLAVVLAVGMWATRPRCPSAASYPQLLRRASR